MGTVKALQATLNAAAALNQRAVTVMGKARGYYCEFYFPESNPSIYGKEDNEIIYSNSPSLTGFFFVSGIPQNQFPATDPSDVWNEEDRFLYLGRDDSDIPFGTKILLRLNETDSRFYPIKAHDTEEFRVGTKLIARKVKIVPMSVKQTWEAK